MNSYAPTQPFVQPSRPLPPEEEWVPTIQVPPSFMCEEEWVPTIQVPPSFMCDEDMDGVPESDVRTFVVLGLLQIPWVMLVVWAIVG